MVSFKGVALGGLMRLRQDIDRSRTEAAEEEKDYKIRLKKALQGYRREKFKRDKEDAELSQLGKIVLRQSDQGSKLLSENIFDDKSLAAIGFEYTRLNKSITPRQFGQRVYTESVQVDDEGQVTGFKNPYKPVERSVEQPTTEDSADQQTQSLLEEFKDNLYGRADLSKAERSLSQTELEGAKRVLAGLSPVEERDVPAVVRAPIPQVGTKEAKGIVGRIGKKLEFLTEGEEGVYRPAAVDDKLLKKAGSVQSNLQSIVQKLPKPGLLTYQKDISDILQAEALRYTIITLGETNPYDKDADTTVDINQNLGLTYFHPQGIPDKVVADMEKRGVATVADEARKFIAEKKSEATGDVITPVATTAAATGTATATATATPTVPTPARRPAIELILGNQGEASLKPQEVFDYINTNIIANINQDDLNSEQKEFFENLKSDPTPQNLFKFFFLLDSEQGNQPKGGPQALRQFNAGLIDEIQYQIDDPSAPGERELVFTVKGEDRKVTRLFSRRNRGS